MSPDNLVILGAGPGGYTAAFLAADLGLKVTLVDTNATPGGVCLHRGCIPSKALLHLAKLISETRQARDWGLDFGEPRIDLEALRKWKNKIVRNMSSGLTQLARQRKVTVVQGHGVFQDPHSLGVSGKETLRFDHCILAVGSRPVMPDQFTLPGGRIMDSTAALELEEVPQKLLVVGGGYIGLEMGTVYAALGSRVTVAEMTPELLPGVDRDLVRPLENRLKKEFENIFLNSRVVDVESADASVRVRLEGEAEPEEQIFDRVLVSVGRAPNSQGIGLENTSVEVDEQGFVQTDSHQRTAEPSILAIGDVAGGALLAHKASHEARVAVHAIAGMGGSAAPGNRTVPAVVFTDPEVAWCGLTETQAAGEGTKVSVAKFPWGASGRAQTLGRSDGLTKLILDPETRRILGVGLVGPGAGELIGEGVLAIQMGAKADDLAASIHPHPTLSETLMETAEVSLGKAVHIYKRPRPS